MDRADMDRVRDEFVRAAEMAHAAGFDMLQLHFAHGYLLGSFLSPLTNRRDDEYGGSLENRMRFPLEVFDAVRAVWPEEKPLAVAINATDWARGGLDLEDAVAMAEMLKDHGCDLVQVLAGQTVPDTRPVYDPGFLVPYSDWVRNEAGVATLVGGHLTTTGQVNTIIGAGRADLCVMEIGD
jgi:anthraniloyl-CoA monooxygenase